MKDFFDQNFTVYSQNLKENFLFVITAPFIYFQIVPIVILDVFVSLYQRVCFPVYKIEQVDRDEYVKFDRHLVSFLTNKQKLDCLYCQYFNGVIAYVREVAGRTEKYWCPLRNIKRKDPHRHYKDFAERTNSLEFQEKYTKN